ncbi:acyl-CoA dehydrogenase family protein [Paenibacillus sp. CAU 1782]
MTAKKGSWSGRFVVEDMAPEWITAPEDFTEEQHMLEDAARQFLEGELLPNDADLEALDYELTVGLMRKAGELGLLGADVPEQYGGLGLDKVSTTLLAETLARASSFALSVGAHVGIGTLPIVFYGTEEQKKRYLPDLASGAKIAAYCLTEPSSGSDALGAKSTARLSADGKSYLLNGSKLYITNAGFADLFIVYAKVDGKQFTAFIVERGTPGLSVGPEETKMGIKGSSTCPLYFEEMAVPVANVLGEVGKGHLIAFHILNIGRFKLGAGCLGSAKETIQLSAAYANTREQFGRPISSYPLIAAKLADMNIGAYILESMVYRIAGWIDEQLGSIGEDARNHVHPPVHEGDRKDTTLETSRREAGSADALAAKAIGEYALECSIVKVFASETLDAIVDEGVQIHGGYGYIKEYKVERLYRDSRINRIFEGTNEINRLLIPGMLLKKAAKGELPLLEKAKGLQGEVLGPVMAPSFDAPLDKESYLVSQAKKVFLLVGGLAVQKYDLRLEEEQEVLGILADLMICIFAMESGLLRAKKALASQEAASRSSLAVLMVETFVQETADKVHGLAKTALVALERGDGLQLQLSILRKLLRAPATEIIGRKRKIAAKVIETEHYVR